jgi:hypothetical protein
MYLITETVKKGTWGKNLFGVDQHSTVTTHLALNNAPLDSLMGIVYDEQEAHALHYIMRGDNFVRAVALFGNTTLTMDEILMFYKGDNDGIGEYLLEKDYFKWLQCRINRLDRQCIEDARHQVFMQLNLHEGDIYEFLTLHGCSCNEKDVERMVRENFGSFGGPMFDRLGEAGMFRHFSRYGYLKGDIVGSDVCNLFDSETLLGFADSELRAKVDALRKELDGFCKMQYVQPDRPTHYETRTVTVSRVRWYNGTIFAGRQTFDAEYME